MKKLFILFSLLCFSLHAQELNQEKEWEVISGFDMYYTSTLNTGNTMTQDAHRKYGNGFGFKLSVVKYKNIGLALFYNHIRNKINDITMIGSFDHTRYNDHGLVISYRIPLTEKMELQPEIGYYGSKAKNTGKRKKAFYDGNGLLIGTEVLF